MATHSSRGYSALQIMLHWAIAVLVIFQLLFGESMTAVVDASEEGTTVSGQDQFLASAHYWVGLAILCLVLIRLILRVVSGVPQAAGATSWMSILASAMHWAFYVLLAAMPVTGLLTFFDIWDLGEVHSIGKPVFIVLIVVHAGAALFHAVYLRDGTLRRMIAPSR